MNQSDCEDYRVWAMVRTDNGWVNVGSVEGYRHMEETEEAIKTFAPYYRGKVLRVLDRTETVIHERIL